MKIYIDAAFAIAKYLDPVSLGRFIMVQKGMVSYFSKITDPTIIESMFTETESIHRKLIFFNGCGFDNTAIANHVLNKGIDICRNNCALVKLCIEKECLNVLKLLLRDKKTRQAEYELVSVAIIHGSAKIIDYILSLKDMKINNYGKPIVMYLCISDKIEIAKKIVCDSRFKFSDLNNDFFISACSTGSNKIVKFLLQENIANPTDADNNGIYSAIKYNNLETIEILLDDGRVLKDKDSIEYLIFFAVKCNQTGPLKLFLERFEIDIYSEFIEDSFFKSIADNRLEIFKVLLQSGKFSTKWIDQKYLLIATLNKKRNLMAKFLLEYTQSIIIDADTDIKLLYSIIFLRNVIEREVSSSFWLIGPRKNYVNTKKKIVKIRNVLEKYRYQIMFHCPPNSLKLANILMF
jgi:ankyrin repeat protein